MVRFPGCLSDNFTNAGPGQLAFLASFTAGAILGTVQSFTSPFSLQGLAAGLGQKAADIPNVNGPGIVDIAGYLNSIVSAGSPEAANMAAATGIYGLMMGGLGDTMNPLVDSVLNMGDAGGAPHGGGGTAEEPGRPPARPGKGGHR